MKFAILLLAIPWALPAQSIQVFSEFQRIDPFGNILPIDRSPSPRELISPAAPRNAFVSFHVVVSVPQGQSYFLYTQANPPDILKLRLYKEQFVSAPGQGWVPDTLSPVGNPAFGVIPDAQVNIPGQTARDYLLDIWVPPDAEVGRRVRVELLLKFGTWTIVPMEIRIQAPVLREPPHPIPVPLPEFDEPADAAAVQALTAHFAGSNPWNPTGTPQTVREVLRRTAQQDMALLADDPVPEPLVWLRAGAQIVNGWSLFPNGAEWYLRIRDAIISRPRR